MLTSHWLDFVQLAVRQLRCALSGEAGRFYRALFEGAQRGWTWRMYQEDEELRAAQAQEDCAIPGADTEATSASQPPLAVDTRAPAASAIPPGRSADSSAGAVAVGSHLSSPASPAITVLPQLSPFSTRLTRTLLPRVWAALAATPPQMELELKRIFAKADKDGSGAIDAKVCT